MASVHVDPEKVHAFKDAQSFYKWLGKHHASETEVWINHKVGSGTAAGTAPTAAARRR